VDTSGAAEAQAQALWQLTSGFFMSARVVQTAWKLGVFDALATASHSASDLAQQFEVDPAGLELVLIACVAIGVLERSGDGRFRNASIAERLRTGTPGSLSNVIAEADHLYGDWITLPEVVRTGKAVGSSDMVDADGLTGYVQGVFRTSSPEATHLAATQEFSNVRRVLDLGGGAGAYAIALARRWPDLQVVVLDRPAVVPIAHRAIARAGLEDRIQVRSGDYQLADFTPEFDLVLLMNVLHQESPARAQIVLRHGARALVNGGRMIVQDVCLGPTSSGPTMAALLGVNTFLRGGGGVHSIAAIVEWLRQACLDVTEQTQHPRTGFSTIIAVRR
jgi:predicted O-methyltransferase YrrM